MKKVLFFLLAVSTCFGNALQDKERTYEGAWISDICWDCFFPFHIAGYNLSSQNDFTTYKKKKWPFCKCGNLKIFGIGTPIPEVVGVPVAFWEPQAAVEVTRTPFRFKIVPLSITNPRTYKNVGSISNSDAGRSSFYNVHYYAIPLFRLALFFPGFTCLRNAEVSMPIFMTEWAPFWSDMDSPWHWVVDPVRFIYADPKLQEYCKKDCDASMKRKPSDTYHWCAGCLGSLYPFCGHVGYHIGGIQASSLLLCRVIGLFHSVGSFLEKIKLNKFGIGTGFEQDNYCEKTHSKKLRKTIYKTQLLSPKPDKGHEKNGVKVYCHPLGDSDRDWGSGHTFPIDGEDFTYIVWTKMHCCYDFVDVFKKAIKALELLSPNEKLEKKKEELEEIEKRIKEFKSDGSQ